MELIILGSFASVSVYLLYRHFNPTLEDLIEKRKREMDSFRWNQEIGQNSLEYMHKVTEWEDRCLAAGMMLPY